MITKNSTRRWLGLLLSVCLCGATAAHAQQRGGNGGGNGGGGGGNSNGGGNRSSTGGSSSSSSGSSTRDYPNSTMIGPATFSVDPETHRVFFITDDITSSNINQVIANLDRPKPQVLIKVVFLEVTHSDDLDFGVEGSYSHNFNPSTVITNNLSTGFGLQNLGITGQQIGGTTMPPGAGLYSIIGSDFTATVRAIASASKVDVLSRPSILVRNNQPATITVGQSVPLVTGVTINALTGSPLSTISYQSVGIILQVTPFITTDGLVEMIVAPQISSLSSQQVQISTNVFAPVIDLRSASTVVVTPDGETVIIGGLMQNSKTTVESKIPILGDIPLLGALFKHKQKDNTKTELLIFLTPHVVNMPSELASASAKEAGKAELAPKAFSAQELDKFFDKLPLKTPVKSDKH